MTTITRETARVADVNLLMSARIRGTPQQCTRAILDEVAGHSSWWRPYLRMSLRPGTTSVGPGCIVDVVAAPRGHPERTLGRTHWSMRLRSLDPGSRLTWSLIDGDYRGWMEWTFDEDRPGVTRVSVRGWLSPHGWNGLRALVWDEVYEVTRLLRRGFDGMSRHLGTIAPPESPFDDDPFEGESGDEGDGDDDYAYLATTPK